MRGLSEPELREAARCSSAEWNTAEEALRALRLFSFRGYMACAADQTWFIVVTLAPVALLLCAGGLYLAGSPLAGWCFVAACVGPLVRVLAALVATDWRVRVSLDRVREGRCSVCGYELGAVAVDRIDTVCPECGQVTIVGPRERTMVTAE